MSNYAQEAYSIIKHGSTNLPPIGGISVETGLPPELRKLVVIETVHGLAPDIPIEQIEATYNQLYEREEG